MKQLKSIFLPNNHTPCENTLKPSYWLWPLWPLSAPGTAALRKTLSPMLAASKDVLTGLSALSKTLRTNNRLFTATLFMLVLAPLSNVAYQLFDKSLHIEGWYHVNYFYLFYILCPWISMVIFFTGVALLFPRDSKKIFFLVIPIAHAIAKILWMVQINSNEAFHHIVPFYFFVPAALIALLWIFLFNWLINRKYHGIDALNARMDGLFLSNMPPNDKIQYLRKTWKQIQNFDNEN